MDDIVVWVDGRLRDPAEPAISAVDHGITVGDGVFETCQAVDGQAFALSRHLRRLTRSARGLGLDDPDLDEVRAGIAAVLDGRPDLGRIRITVTAGVGPLGSTRSGGRQTVVVVAGAAGAPRPVRSVRVPWVRNERSPLTGLKTTSYAENVVAVAAATKVGADESWLANTRGELCEGTGSNVFVEVGGELLTPPLSSGCLAGITRELVLEWSAQAGLPVREQTLPWSVLDTVTAGDAGLALCGSIRTFVPVVELDGVALEPFPLTLEVAELYRRRAADDIDP
ncbi:aminotransferase class IV [Actinotalea sp. M2MS4P-6]|uniref:aminotransferase class IV n=1 Tax=Actinotalea sp. M2MS4P-6 TaxID=2983762 RepID=UPI0021E362A7|nr:aminotransferase class IV [Actinotalea sp. M2MS4P-6]MCV2394517.1 aminotransferase class IV [Actinotalea sp. M2MS4P-6]